MKTNKAAKNMAKTYEGGTAAARIHPVQQLERQVATCMLFENTFYQSGSEIASQIAATCKTVPVEEIARLAIKARGDFKLRHVPLFLLAQLNLRRDEKGSMVKETVNYVVRRPDEMGELLSIIQKLPENKGKPLKKVIGSQVKKGLAFAFTKFSPYQLAKWNRDSEIKLRDVLFLVHAKPKTQEQREAWPKLIEGTLEAADTWEVALSGGADKKATFERLLSEEKLGYMALLMNLRNMEQSNVDRKLVKKALIDGAPGSKALPFRFVTAAKHAPGFEQALSDAMVKALSTEEKLDGMTYIVIDVSGSMDSPISNKSETMRWQTAGALAVLLREIVDDTRVFTFSDDLMKVPDRRGIPLIEAVGKTGFGWTNLGGSLTRLKKEYPKPDRIVVITDEQAHPGYAYGYGQRTATLPSCWADHGYIINVAPYQPGLETSGGWTRINGWSERVVDFVRWHEANPQ